MIGMCVWWLCGKLCQDWKTLSVWKKKSNIASGFIPSLIFIYFDIEENAANEFCFSHCFVLVLLCKNTHVMICFSNDSYYDMMWKGFKTSVSERGKTILLPLKFAILKSPGFSTMFWPGCTFAVTDRYLFHIFQSCERHN